MDNGGFVVWIRCHEVKIDVTQDYPGDITPVLLRRKQREFTCAGHHGKMEERVAGPGLRD